MKEMPVILFGAIFVLLGALGFVSNPLIGEHALFATDAAHNWIHLFLGGVLLASAFFAKRSAARPLKLAGIAALLLGASGLLAIPAAGGSLLGIAYANGASSWLNLVIGALMYAAPFYRGAGRGAR